MTEQEQELGLQLGAANAEIRSQAKEIEELKADADKARHLVNEQAEDEGLWFEAQYASEAYLQAALRKLHAAIEQQ